MINPGSYKARATEGALGFTEGGKEQVAVLFEILEGEYSGQTLTWRGYFTDKTEERTLESLMIAGWDGENLAELAGLGATECTIVVKHEEYDGKMQVRIAWVNRLGGLAMKNMMNEGDKAKFAQRMRGRAAAVKQKMRSRGEEPTSFNYGANSGDDDLPPGLR